MINVIGLYYYYYYYYMLLHVVIGIEFFHETFVKQFTLHF
jgi:hypothetical protein